MINANAPFLILITQQNVSMWAVYLLAKTASYAGYVFAILTAFDSAQL